jgi:hypothetical protein
MIKRYTFLRHPFYFVLENSSKMVGGLEKCIGVFYNDVSKTVEAISSENGLNRLQIDDVAFIERLRQSKKQSNWIKKEQVPFEVGESTIEQLSFADEEQSSILELHFPNSADRKFDVLYLYFKNNIGNFKVSSVEDAMAVDIKGVIQTLMYNQISLLIKSNRNDVQIHQEIGATLNDSSLQNKINQLKRDEIDIARSNYNYILNKLTTDEVIEFGLSTEAVKRLSDQRLGLGEVEQVLSKSIGVIINKYNPVSFYELTELDLIIDRETTKPSLSIKQENLNNTQQFLDKYESAAKIVLSKNERITGLNIGEHCHPKVSPAAISDILKKHQIKIVLLLQQHPDRWPIIKNKFKPISNIVERSKTSNVRLGA